MSRLTESVDHNLHILYALGDLLLTCGGSRQELHPDTLAWGGTAICEYAQRAPDATQRVLSPRAEPLDD